MKEPQFIIDSAGNRTGVILDLESYYELLGRFEDVAATGTSARPATDSTDETLPFTQHRLRAKKVVQGTPGAELLKFVGTISPETLDEMEQAIEEGCEQIGPAGWHNA